MRRKKFFDSKIISCFTSADNTFMSEHSADENDEKKNIFTLPTVKARAFFASSAESSPVARFLEYLYYSFLHTPLSAVGIFLLVYSITSFSLKFAVNESKFSFLYSSECFFILSVAVIAILFIPVKKNMTFLLSQSKLFSIFEFSYDKKIMHATVSEMKFSNGYSTAFFLGILGGISSVIFAPERVLLFIILLLCAILIINRPECGVLLSLFLIPFADSTFMTVLPIYTFFCLIYKFFRAKRHISYGTDETLLTAIAIIFLISGIFTVSGKSSLYSVMPVLSVILLYICIKNMVKSISVFNKCIKAVNASSRILSIAVIITYLSTLLLSKSYIDRLCEVKSFESIYLFLTCNRDIPLFITLTYPLTLSFAFDREKSTRQTGNIFFLFVQFAAIMLYRNINIITAVVLSSIIVFIFHSRKNVILLPFVPMVSHFLIFLSEFIPSNSSNFISVLERSNSYIYKSILSLTENNILFGIGTGEENFSACISQYLPPMTVSPSHAQTSFLSILVSLGLVATVFIFYVIFRLSFKNIKYAVSLCSCRCNSFDTVYAGIIGAETVFIMLTFTMYIPCQSAVLFMFASLLALGKCAENCVKFDFIDNTKVRI